MGYLTVLFDFDGTLADTQELALRALSAVAPEFGIRPITKEELPALKKLSAFQLLQQRSGIPLWRIMKIRRLERRLREEFRAHAEGVALFAGIPDLLRRLRGAGYEVGIVSSNEYDVIEGALARAGVEVNFIHAGSKFFGKVRAIRNALREYSVSRSRTLYIGDELRDVEACGKTHLDMIAVGWGFNEAETLRQAGVRVVQTPEELLSILIPAN